LAQIGVLFEMGECKGSDTKEPSLTCKLARYCNFYVTNNYGGTKTLVPMDKVDLQMAINKQWRLKRMCLRYDILILETNTYHGM
jgi:hypothetical protein